MLFHWPGVYHCDGNVLSEWLEKLEQRCDHATHSYDLHATKRDDACTCDKMPQTTSFNTRTRDLGPRLRGLNS